MTATDHNELSPADTSEAEEMYLITIAMAIEDGHEGPVPVPLLAEELEVTRVTANEMVRKLAERDLITYTPYKGVSLAEDGERIARTILRRRRLWSLFLADRLGLTPQAADTVACEFEHMTPSDVASRLADFLGDPECGPQGKPIPKEGQAATQPRNDLTSTAVGASVEVLAVQDDRFAEAFLSSQGVGPGTKLTVLAMSEDGNSLVATENGRLNMAGEIARAVIVTAT